ncbi:MAG: alkaline phosphatase D family protein [Myxococcota bacterium]
MLWMMVLAGCSKTSKLPDYVVENANRFEKIIENMPEVSEEDARPPVVPEGPALPDSVQTIVFGSCLQQEKPAPILDVMAARRADLLVMLGDNVYGDVSPDDPWLMDLHYAYWGLVRHEAFTRLVTSTPVLATWDDHDYGLNDAGAEFGGRAYSEKMFEKFWRVEPGTPASLVEGVYSASMFGEGDRVVQLLLLDLRSFKSPFDPTDERGKPGAERYVPTDDAERTMLGAAQWDWLDKQLQQPAALRIVVSSLQVHADGHGWERWGLLPVERDRLYRTLAARVGGAVVIVSGDRHRAGIYERPDLAGGPYPEMTTSSLNLVFEGVEEAGPHRIGPTYLDENYGSLAIDWDAGDVALAVHDITGEPVLEHRVELP